MPKKSSDAKSNPEKSFLKRLIDGGKNKGYITYEELNDYLPDNIVNPDDIDDLMLLFEKLDIMVIDDAWKQEFARRYSYIPNETEFRDTATIIFPDISKEFFQFVRSNPHVIYSMTPRRFEEFVAAIFENHGFNVELTPSVKDGGFDVIAVRKDIITGANVHLVECKRYKPTNKIGVGLVRCMLGVVESERATKGHIVTSSFFTTPAKNFACVHKTRLKLSDFNSIIDWLNSLSLSNFAKV